MGWRYEIRGRNMGKGYRYAVLFSLLSLCFSALQGASIAALGLRYPVPKHVLVVASDIDDVFWAHRVQEALKAKGIDVSVDVLYLWKNYPSAPSERRKLSSTEFLWRYDAVLLPDLNEKWMYGGRLTPKETRKLLLYASRGHLVLIGMNTIVQNWYAGLEKAAGIRITGVTGAKNDTWLFDVVYQGRIYGYNDTLGAVLVEPTSAVVVARFRYEQKPAITINKYGDGIVAFTAFNVVEAVVFQRNGDEFANLVADILAPLIMELKPLPPPSSYMLKKRLEGILDSPIRPFASLYRAVGGGILGILIVLALAAIMIYTVLLVLAYTCMLGPEKGAKILKPFLASKKLSLYEKKITLILSEEIAQSMEELASRLGIKQRVVCRVLTQLLARNQVAVIKADGVTYYALRDRAHLALVMSNPVYQRIVELIDREPGITVHEVAARLGIPFDTALKLCKELASKGVIEMRKVMLEYELYPLKTLLSAKEWSKYIE
jgi:ribosomal protein S25